MGDEADSPAPRPSRPTSALRRWARRREGRLRRWWRQPSARAAARLAATWGIGGLLVGVLATLVLLIAVAPAPPAVRVPSGTPVITITLNDAALTQITTAAIAQAALPIALGDVRAHIEPGARIALSAEANGLPGVLPHRLATEASLVVASGQLRVHILHASVGGVGMPSVLTTALARALDDQLARAQRQLAIGSTRYQIISVSSVTGRLTLGLAPAG